MSDDAANPVVQDPIKEEVSPLAEDTTPKQDPQVAETPTEEHVEEKVNPLEPGGARFKEVWARSKKAEAEAKALQAELQREREERIRLEERTKVKEEQIQQKEMSWDELENGIAEGKWTRAQAQEYKDKMTEVRLQRKLEEQSRQKDTTSKILGEISQYQKLIPDVMQPGSESRQKYEREFAYMVRELGLPNNHATELAAVRAAFGDIETVKTKSSLRQSEKTKEPFMETHTPQRQSSNQKSYKDSLSPWQVNEYERLIKHRVYKDWKEIEEEQKWAPKAINQGRR